MQHRHRGGRCKQSGMFWSKSGAENILALRCLLISGSLEDFGKYRLNQHAARSLKEEFCLAPRIGPTSQQAGISRVWSPISRPDFPSRMSLASGRSAPRSYISVSITALAEIKFKIRFPSHPAANSLYGRARLGGRPSRLLAETSAAPPPGEIFLSTPHPVIAGCCHEK